MATFALSLLCENPLKLTGLNSLFREFVARSLRDDESLKWIVFIGPEHQFDLEHPRLTLVRDYRGNNQLKARLMADHFKVSPHAKRLGADLLFTIGFVPLVQSIPTVMHLLTLHHLDRSNQMDPLRSFYRRWAVENGLRRAKLVITNSQFAVSQILGAAPHVKPKLIQSYEGIDHAAFQPQCRPEEKTELVAALKIPSNYIVWLSNLYPYKQPDLFVRAYAKLPASLREQYPIVFVGGDWDGQKAKTKELATQLGVGEQVIFPGWVADEWITPLLRHARLHVMPSREETFGRSVAEAMACGTPCVVNDIPVMREVTQGAAWVENFGNEEAAAAALQDALTNEDARAEMIAKGLRRAADFNFDKLTRERMEVIRPLLRQPSAP